MGTDIKKASGDFLPKVCGKCGEMIISRIESPDGKVGCLSCFSQFLALGDTASSTIGEPPPSGKLTEDPLAKDNSFLSYVEIHSSTERALFSKEHTVRLLRLAGEDEEAETGEMSFLPFMVIRHDVAKPLIEAARKRMVAK